MVLVSLSLPSAGKMRTNEGMAQVQQEQNYRIRENPEEQSAIADRLQHQSCGICNNQCSKQRTRKYLSALSLLNLFLFKS